MGIIHPNRRTALARADRWLMTGTRPSWMDGRPPACACRSSGAVPRPACTSGLWGNAGSRARTRRCSAGSGVGGGASSTVGRLRRIEVGAGKRAGRFRPSPGRGRWRGTGRAFPGGVVPVFEHALGGGVAGRDRGMRVPGSAGGVREDGHGARGRGVRQRRRRGPPQRRRHGRPDPSVLPVPRALRVRAPVPRPVFRPREGRRGERGRLSRGAT